jgi:hypothetical protein
MRKIEFFTIVNGVADAFPVIKASEYKPKWIANAKESFNKKLEAMDGAKFFHLYRCPGIFDLMGQGYIVCSPWDITIDTNGDGEDFRWRITDSEITMLLGDDPVQGHMARAIAESMPAKPYALRSLIKFNTSWNIRAPKGVKFLILPLSYPDTYEFESAPGILDPSFSTELNAQLYWNVLNNRHTVKAGTPLFQIIPLTEEKFKFEVRNATPEDIEWTKKRRYFTNIGFGPKRGLMKSLYNKLFGTK